MPANARVTRPHKKGIRTAAPVGQEFFWCPRAAWEQALASYQEAVRLRPDHPEALANLGVALAERGQGEEAIRCFREALRPTGP